MEYGLSWSEGKGWSMSWNESKGWSMSWNESKGWSMACHGVRVRDGVCHGMRVRDGVCHGMRIMWIGRDRAEYASSADLFVLGMFDFSMFCKKIKILSETWLKGRRVEPVITRLTACQNLGIQTSSISEMMKISKV